MRTCPLAWGTYVRRIRSAAGKLCENVGFEAQLSTPHIETENISLNAWRRTHRATGPSLRETRHRDYLLQAPSMRCPACGFENASGIKFCGECGAPLKVKCPSCGFDNAPGTKFCGECGTDVQGSGGGSRVSIPSSTPTPDTVGERRQLTVLFCD